MCSRRVIAPARSDLIRKVACQRELDAVGAVHAPAESLNGARAQRDGRDDEARVAKQLEQLPLEGADRLWEGRGEGAVG